MAQATPNLDFIEVPSPMSAFVNMLRKVYRNLVTNVINGHIGFGDGSKADNLDGVWSNVTAPIAPNTDFTITHNLGRLPVGYWVMQKDRACDVYTGSVATTKTQLTLRATVASAVLRLFIIGLLLFLTSTTQAQTTNVVLQVTDAGAQSWNNGSWSALLVNTLGQSSPSVTFNQIGTSNPVPNQNQSGVLGATGSATMTLTQNSQITPIGSLWRFVVCPQATSPCFTQYITVTSTTAVTITPASIVVSCGPSVNAYADSEVNCGIGGQYYSLTLNLIRFCTASTGNTCTAWSSVSKDVGPLTGQFNVKDFGAVGDAKLSRNTAFTQLGSTITDTTNNPFTPLDVGKFITCVLAPGNGSNPINTANGIAQITSATPPSSVSIAPNTMIGGIGSTGGICVWYTHDDASAFCCGAGSAFAAAHTSVSGGISGIGGNGPGIITSVPKAAITCSGGFAVGGYILNEVEAQSGTLGVSLQGTGCFIYWLPSSTTGIINYVNSSQFVITGLDMYGEGFANSSATTPFIKISTSGSFWVNDNRISSWGSTAACPGTNQLVEIDSPNGPSLFSKNIVSSAGNGGCGLVCTSCQSYPTIDNNYIGNDSGPNMILSNGLGRNTAGGALVVRNHQGDECGLAQGTGLGNACVQLANQTVMFEGGTLFGPGASISLDGTSEADFYGMNVGAFTSAGNFPAIIGANGAKVFATNTTIRGNGTGVALQGPGAGSMTFNDLGGNVIQNCVTTTCSTASIAQTFAGNVNTFFPLTPTATTQLGGSQTVAGNAPTACTITGNGTSTCAFDPGSTNAAGRITITAAGTTTAVGLVSFSFASPSTISTNSSNCSANYLSGTGTWAIGAVAPIFITNTTSGVSFNINNAGTNLTAGSTYKVNYTCYGQ